MFGRVDFRGCYLPWICSTSGILPFSCFFCQRSALNVFGMASRVILMEWFTYPLGCFLGKRKFPLLQTELIAEKQTNKLCFGFHWGLFLVSLFFTAGDINKIVYG